MASQKLTKHQQSNTQPNQQLKKVVSEIQSDIEAIEKDITFFDEINFNSRAEAIDDIDFHIIGRIDAFLQNVGHVDEIIWLRQHAELVKAQLEKIDDSLFRRLRKK